MDSFAQALESLILAKENLKMSATDLQFVNSKIEELENLISSYNYNLSRVDEIIISMQENRIEILVAEIKGTLNKYK